MKAGTENRRQKDEELFEGVEIEYVGLSDDEYERRICALIHALLEIDRVLKREDNPPVPIKEAA